MLRNSTAPGHPNTLFCLAISSGLIMRGKFAAAWSRKFVYSQVTVCMKQSSKFFIRFTLADTVAEAANRERESLRGTKDLSESPKLAASKKTKKGYRMVRSCLVPTELLPCCLGVLGQIATGSKSSHRPSNRDHPSASMVGPCSDSRPFPRDHFEDCSNI